LAKKRAPGAGRKPRGEFKGKTATLTTRITPETRAALERAAEKSRRSLSQEVEHRLDYSIRRDYEHNRDRHIRGLAETIAILTHWVERATQKRWIDDPFTAEALRRGIEFLVFHFGAPGTPEVPASVKDAAARVPLQARDQSMTPAGVGHAEAGGLISWIEMNVNEGGRLSRKPPPVPEFLKPRISKFYVPQEWYLYSQLFSELGSGWARHQKLMRREGGR
jgi:TraY domain